MAADGWREYRLVLRLAEREKRLSDDLGRAQPFG